MSGHSKWSKVKNQKAVTDVQKAAAFTRASRAITVAVKEGGGIIDPDRNFRLRLAIEKAREVNMPKDNIQRILEKAAGGVGEGSLVTAVYEAYGPSGIAILIEVLTDNPNRAYSGIRSLVEHHGGTIVSKGAVSHLFKQKGVIMITKNPETDFDSLFLSAVDLGAEDVLDIGDQYNIVTLPGALAGTRTGLLEAGFMVQSTGLVFQPDLPVPVPPDDTRHLSDLINLLTDLDDVQQVFTNAL